MKKTLLCTVAVDVSAMNNLQVEALKDFFRAGAQPAKVSFEQITEEDEATKRIKRLKERIAALESALEDEEDEEDYEDNDDDL